MTPPKVAASPLVGASDLSSDWIPSFFTAVLSSDRFDSKITPSDPGMICQKKKIIRGAHVDKKG